MKKLLILFAIFIATFLSAKAVNLVTAKQIAINWTKSHSNNYNFNPSVKDAIPVDYKGTTALYVIRFAKGGFALISADDAAYPILGYSSENNFEYPIKSPEVKYWIKHYEKQLNYIISNKIDNASTIKFWKSILKNDVDFNRSDRDVSPLLSTTWNQGQYFNELCPYDTNSSAGNNHVWAGCVATATTQVMKFWNYPTQGTGSHSYTDPTYGAQSANFGATTYDWASMPNHPTSTLSSITTLLYHVGVSVDMEYGADGSGAWVSDAATALKTYFDYSSDATMKMKSDYTDTGWENILKDNLNNGRPLVYRGYGTAGGHAFVCDGYQGTNYFHFNWGWSGSSDGYYYLNNLNPGGYTFNDSQGAIFGIHPNSNGNFPAPSNLTATLVNNSSVNLAWDAPSRTFSNYKIYKNNLLLATTASTSYTDNDVSGGNSYTYYVTAAYTSPDGESAHSNTATVEIAADLPYSTDFSTTNGWTQQSVGCSDRWASSSTSSAGGSSPEMKATWEDSDPATTRLISPAFNTQNFSSLDLSFKHFYDYYGSGVTIKIQSSSNKINWTDESWSLTPSGDVSAETVTTTVTHNLGDVTYIAWVITGNLYNFNYWYVDDVSISVPNIPLISISPTNIDYGNVYVGTSVTHQFTIQNDGHATLTGDIILLNGYNISEASKSDTLHFSIASTSAKTFDLELAPQTIGYYNGNITINSNATNEQQSYVAVTGHAGYHAIISVNKDSLRFGNVLLGEYASKTFTVYNDGDEELSGTITPPADYYVYEDTTSFAKNISFDRAALDFSITAHQSKKYITYFYPLTTGLKTGIITFSSNDPYNTPPTINVSGTGYLAAPTNITVTIDNNNVVINWDYNSKASIYHVYSSDNPYSGFTQLGTIPQGPFTVLNGGDNGKKFYKVTAE